MTNIPSSEMTSAAIADWVENYADAYTGGAGEDDQVVQFASIIANVIRSHQGSIR